MNSKQRQALAKAWPHLRVVLIFTHVAAMFVMCLPAPYKMANRRAWHTPQARAELASWGKRLGVSADELEDTMFGVTRSYLSVRDQLNKPFARYHRISHMRQGWSMFTHPQTHPGWLHVELRNDSAGKYRPIYVQRSSEHTWRRRQFDHNRLRKLLGRIARRPTGHPAYNDLANWIARQAATDFPTATHVRVRHFRARTVKPGHAKPAPGRFVDQRVYALDKYR